MPTVLALITLSLQMLISSSLACPYRKYQCNVTSDNCVSILSWCDGICDCPNCEDENFCNPSNIDRCYSLGMFRCDNGACIPAEGKCDVFRSCQDSSDESNINCCEKLNEATGLIGYHTIVGGKSHKKCWEIEVPPDKYLKLKLYIIVLRPNPCWKSHILVKEKNILDQEKVFTICERNSTDIKEIVTFHNTEIIYVNKGVEEWEKFNIEYSIVDLDVLCKRPGAFKCNAYTCVAPEKRCNGYQDCFNGLDEVGCEKGVSAVEGVNTSRHLGLQWLKNQRNDDWGWSQNTHRAVTAMYLAEGANYNGSTKEEDLTLKQLELQMLIAILRNGTDVITPAQLSMFINAFLVICHDPKNFYDYNLVSELKKLVQNSEHFHPISYLALCNAGVTLSKDDVGKLLSVLDGSSQHIFKTDIEAIATLALSCVIQSSQFSHLRENLTSVTKNFKKMQMEDGSFGNIYTTALVVQALLASGDEKAKDWNLTEAVEFLKGKQNKDDGSFGDFLATYLILPILYGKSLLDIGKINCTENLQIPRNGNPVFDIDLNLGSKIYVNYFLIIGDYKDQQHTIALRVPENITVLEIMRLAADADPKYRFKYETIKNKTYIYEISGIANDAEDGKFWLLHTGEKNEAMEIETRSVDEIKVYEQKHVVMWYKSVKLL